MKSLRLTLAAVCLLIIGCSKKTEEAAAKHDHGPGHVHVAPHGGTLVEIGEHAYNVELLRDRAAGKLTVWVLDGHAENFVRIKAPAIELVAMPGGQFTPLSLKAVANPATGETVGDTSMFEVQADFLKTAGSFSGILTVEIKGTRFEKIAYGLPE